MLLTRWAPLPPQVPLRVFTMHWAGDNRWDFCWLLIQSESSSCLASACKPLFGIWCLKGVGLIITQNQSEFCLICFLFFFLIRGFFMWNGHAGCLTESSQERSLGWLKLKYYQGYPALTNPPNHLIVISQSLEIIPWKVPLCLVWQNAPSVGCANSEHSFPLSNSGHPELLQFGIMATAEVRPGQGLLRNSLLKLWINLP